MRSQELSSEKIVILNLHMIRRLQIMEPHSKVITRTWKDFGNSRNLLKR